jgi:6-phosphofructokinase 1
VSERSAGNLLVLQGGGPTQVLNASLFGVIDEARPSYRRVLGARFGVEGLVKGDVVDLSAVPATEIARLKDAPGASLGSTRYKATAADLDRIIGVLRGHEVRSLIIIGGNGSLRGAEVIGDAVARDGYDCRVVGVPKTIDNDIPATDRCPGFGSAARYVAQAVRDLAMDVRGLPQPVSLYETMGRSVGWLAGASVLARQDENDAPHLVYLPERAFDVDRFLAEIDRAVAKHGWGVAVLCEGLNNPDGQPVYENRDATQTDALGRSLPGGVAAHLADVVTQRLKIRCRWEKPGLCGRASMLHVSEQDRRDAELVGRAAVRAALEGRHAHMISLRPLKVGEGGYDVIPLAHAAGGERRVPAEWLGESASAPVMPAFLDYVRPLAGKLIDYPRPLKDRLPAASTIAARERQNI